MTIGTPNVAFCRTRQAAPSFGRERPGCDIIMDMWAYRPAI